MSAKIIPVPAQEEKSDLQASSSADRAADVPMDAATVPKTPVVDSVAMVEVEKTDGEATEQLTLDGETQPDSGNAEYNEEKAPENSGSTEEKPSEPPPTSPSGLETPAESKVEGRKHPSSTVERIQEAERFVKTILTNMKRLRANFAARTRPSPETQEKIDDLLDQLLAGKEIFADRAVGAYHSMKEWANPTPPRPELGEHVWKVPYIPPNEVNITARVHEERHADLRAHIIGKRKAFQDMVEFVEDADPEVVAAELQARAMRARAEDLARGSGTGRIVLDPDKPPQTQPQTTRRPLLS